MKKCLPAIVAAILTIIIVLIPFPKSPVHLRFTVDGYNGKECYLYYTTDNSYSFIPEQVIESSYDQKRSCITVTFDPKLIGSITGMRFDFYPANQEFHVKDVTISSGGVIQKRLNPVDVFTSQNIILTNGINDINLIVPWNAAIIQTSDQAPFLVFGDEIVSRIRNCQSSYRITRLLVCLFLSGCILPLFYRKKS